MSGYRVLVEKKPGFTTEADSLRTDLNESFHLGLSDVRVLNVYDLFGVSSAELDTVKNNVLSENATDFVTAAPGDDLALLDEYIERGDIQPGDSQPQNTTRFAIEYLPGQYDQRADSALQCLALLCGNDSANIKSGKLIVLNSPSEIPAPTLTRIKKYLINPVESREKNLAAPLELEPADRPQPVPVMTGFTRLNEAQLERFLAKHGMAMSLADALMIQGYFRFTEHREPTETELKVLDTYWSDHCRHTTFETRITDVTFEPGRFNRLLQNGYDDYLSMRSELGATKPITLMDMATIAAKDQRRRGLLDDLEISEEINACSVFIDVDVDGVSEPWLLMFKNETHNHPTEIEPFGGASTCIGGAIRDPLSGRSYVYQAMRIAGGADITEPIEETLPGKLPQKVIAKGSAHGNSSYGNQIGLATSFVRELFHDGYKAKHLETGAVVGAAPVANVKRLAPQAGDVILLVGGGTGRDGIGGATGSSKVHTSDSVTTASSEVQKGNAPMERKIQRLFRDREATALIKKCNDFGAGGVCVAIGELADGLDIDLDAVPVKYQGLTGTELAISESQERMAVLVAPTDVEKFQELAARENLDAVVVAHVTDNGRLTMRWRGETIVDLARDFLNTNGATQEIDIVVPTDFPLVGASFPAESRSFRERFLANLAQPNVASRQGMEEMFDASIGAGTVLMPYGGKYQLTEAEGSVHKLPVRHGDTDTVSILTYGFNPQLMSASPFHGAVCAVVESVARVVALGGDWQGIRFSFQEYFQRLENDPRKWAQPFSALLGAIYAQNAFGLPAIGGKDSMSGTFHELSVPPTLISFAVQTARASEIISSEFKAPGHYVYLIDAEVDGDLLPNIAQLKENYTFVHEAIRRGDITAAATVKQGGIAAVLAKMAFGNKVGVAVAQDLELDLFAPLIGDLVVASKVPLANHHARLLGKTIEAPRLLIGDTEISIDDAIAAWQGTYQQVYPLVADAAHDSGAPALDGAANGSLDATISYFGGPKTQRPTPRGTATPTVYLPVFPGTNCEYDSARAFESYGANTVIDVFCNRNSSDVQTSIERMARHLDSSQILMLSGGFSAGDEPDGSGKYIAAVLSNEQIRSAVDALLARGGLILGICNGFQALVKVGLLPYGQFGQITDTSPTLVKNDINRHVSKIVQTRVCATMSPWLAQAQVGDLHQVAISHGEGKFVADEVALSQLITNGQVATQYVDLDGRATMDPSFNPNGSTAAIEGITSPDGRIFGKMGHSERWGKNLYKNVAGNYDQRIFSSGVDWFRTGV